jgi:electron transfer flavoprotein beta subunit
LFKQLENRVKILIAVKQVSVLEEDFELAANGREIDADFRSFDLNEWDDYSLEQALLTKEAGGEVEVVVVTVGDDEADAGLRKCLAKGADRAIRVWDDALGGSDPVAIGRVLAKVAARESPDFFFAGVQSSDFAFGATGLAAAGFLGWPHVAVVSKFELDGNKAKIRRELEGGMEEAMEVDLPAVLTIQLGINKPRYASLRGIKQAAALPIEALSPADLGLNDDQIGEAGSASHVRRMYVPEKRGGAQIIEGTPAEQAAQLAKIIKTFQGA